MPDATDLITLTEAAERLGVSRQTIWRWTKAGRLTVTRVGKVTLIAVADLDAFKEAS